MYAHPFHYHRAKSLAEATSLLAELGDEAKLLAGGQSLIPLMKFRLAAPQHLIDLNFIPDANQLREEDDGIHFGALTRHRDIEFSELSTKIPLVKDCAAGIADVQVRNRGTLAGSLAEADPSGDWTPALLTLDTRVICQKGDQRRSIALPDFVVDAYTTALDHDEVIAEVVVKKPPAGSGGAYLAFKRSAQVYGTVSVALQLVLDGDSLSDLKICLGSVGLLPIRVTEAENALKGKPVSEESYQTIAEAAMAAADPQTDSRGSADFKRRLTGALVKKALDRAVRRARGEEVEGGHIYA